ncbi:TonB-dependent receptor plug domain-containing protein [Reichenbachiella ulvae]|uniref:TonB-dependent receptor plug domain-containing protein n=1 Tax=Reichenbachiella ulvae TaxID=2980104 RepID=A0ABT3CSH7_9BACT|nr:TonB-dependent receptor plug domain-containing protein [Reichenbachiella ulvae]MCV9386661.1 TonB-dependent receptor plug domain-containing protein [Reichenbachiella ulvae]
MKLIFTLLMGLITVCSSAQHTRGTVTAFGDVPLRRVEVKAKSGANTLTNERGEFVLETKKKDALTFSAAGFVDKRIKKRDNADINVNLLIEDWTGAEEEAVSNRHISAADMKKGLETVGYTNYEYYEMSSIYEVLRREHPGIRMDESGQDKNVYLVNQGVHSISMSQEALLVVDGSIVDDISMIQPMQIKSIKVLLGPDAAHWGVRGANGVIEIDLMNGER